MPLLFLFLPSDLIEELLIQQVFYIWTTWSLTWMASQAVNEDDEEEEEFIAFL